jgi:hypothetical protein
MCEVISAVTEFMVRTAGGLKPCSCYSYNPTHASRASFC